MKPSTFQKIKLVTGLFILVTIVVAFSLSNIFWALAAVFVGILFLLLLRMNVAGVVIDERLEAITNKAAYATLVIFIISMGICSFIFLFFGQREYYILEALGVIFSYLTLFFIVLFCTLYVIFERGWGAGGHEE